MQHPTASNPSAHSVFRVKMPAWAWPVEYNHLPLVIVPTLPWISKDWRYDPIPYVVGIVLIHLQLLEDHLQKLRDEENVVMEEDDEAAWNGWDVDSDSSDSESEGWIDVDDNDDNLHISDSEDEDKPKDPPPDAEANPVDPATRISTLATTKVGRFRLFHCLILMILVDPHPR